MMAARGYVTLTAFPIISQVLGGRVAVTWPARGRILDPIEELVVKLRTI